MVFSVLLFLEFFHNLSVSGGFLKKRPFFDDVQVDVVDFLMYVPDQMAAMRDM